MERWKTTDIMDCLEDRTWRVRYADRRRVEIKYLMDMKKKAQDEDNKEEEGGISPAPLEDRSDRTNRDISSSDSGDNRDNQDGQVIFTANSAEDFSKRGDILREKAQSIATSTLERGDAEAAAETAALLLQVASEEYASAFALEPFKIAEECNDTFTVRNWEILEGHIE